MKTLKNLNTVALLIPIVLGLAGFINESLFILAGLSTMITGFIQVLIGIYFWSLHIKNISIIAYLITVILFFTLWYYNSKISYNDNLTTILFGIPPLLAICLSVIIYTQKETK
jgi:hypothetical protein